MYIYILNLLNDSIRNKEEKNKYLALEIINDTKYITELGGINKKLDSKMINDNLNNVVELLCKYNLSFKETMSTLNKLLVNKGNMWILEYFYKSDFNIRIDSSYLTLSCVISEILQKARIGMEGLQPNCLAL